MDWLQRWWCKKYKRPAKDPLLAQYTTEELAIELLQDLIEKDIQEAVPRNGSVMVRTGDAVADRWEQEILKTGTFDPTQVLNTVDKQRLDRFLKAVESAPQAAPPTPPTPRIDDDPRAEISPPPELEETFNDTY